MTTRTGQAAVARARGADFGIETVAFGPPRAGEILVRIAGVGVCHTDLVFRDQFDAYPLPAVLGHEGAGIVEAVGEGVEDLSAGDKVVIGFSSCGQCARCDEALPSYCQSFVPLNYAGMRIDDGSTAIAASDGGAIASHFFGQSSFGAYAVTRRRNAVKIDNPSAPLEILGPLGCGFQTGAGGIMRSLACPTGSTLLVFGGGPVGLAAVMGAVIQGCATIVMVEPIASRRAMASELGATDVIDPGAGDLAAAIRDILPLGADFAFDTTGIPAIIETGLASLGAHGAIGLVGVPKALDAAISVNIAALMTPGHRIVGIIEGDSDPQDFIPELLAHHAAGRFPFDRLIKTYGLSEINEAVAAQARGDCVKVVLIP